MCLLAIHVQCTPHAPLVVAANREEYFNRPSLPPHLQPGDPQVLCGVDQRAGGTWLGVNEFGLFVAVTNRWELPIPLHPRSRGALCRDLLTFADAESAIAYAQQELDSGRYAGANFVCADIRDAFLTTNDVKRSLRRLEPGLHLLANRQLDDPEDPRLRRTRSMFESQRLGSDLAELIRRAKEICALPSAPQQPGIVLRFADRGTVSSSIVALTEDSQEAVYLHADGAPDRVPYGDFSASLRRILSPRI